MSIDTKEPIWFTTGNPFVDMGQEMMAALAGVDKPEDLTLQDVEPLLSRLTKLYLMTDWRKTLHTIFPNSKLVNASVKQPEQEYLKLLEGWLKQIGAKSNLGVPCAISGKSAQTYVNRAQLPMSDAESGNFQSANDTGVPVSAPVALALQFTPLSLVKVGKMLALPHFSNEYVQYQWAEDSVKHVLQTEALSSGSVRDTGTFRTVNAFFKLVEGLVRDHQDLPNSSVTLYLFNNFNQVDYKAASELYYMPARVFSFIQTAMRPQVRQGWQRIVRRGYRYAKDNVDDEGELQKYSNLVYERLLANESISGFFLNRKERCPVVRGLEGWMLFSAYLKEVRGMDQRRLDSLRDLGDRIATLVRDRRKRLLALERARSRGELTEVLYRLTKDAAAAGHDQPLITFDQLVSDVFPVGAEYSDWREVKNLLLFRIYEQLFDDLKSDPTWIETDTDETEEQAA
jgi:CRISPR-associated protein Cst1